MDRRINPDSEQRYAVDDFPSSEPGTVIQASRPRYRQLGSRLLHLRTLRIPGQGRPMMHPSSVTRFLRFPGAAPVLALFVLLTACGDNAKPEATATTAHVSNAIENGLPSPEALPDCGRIGATMGAVVSGWKLIDQSGPWENPAQSGYGVDCIWWSPLMQSDGLEALKGASLMVRINVTPQMQSESDVRSIGWVIDDPAVNAIGGYLTIAGGKLEFDAPLGPIPPEVVVGNVSVSVARSGVMVVNSTDEAGSFTHRRAVEAAVALHQLILD